MQIIYGIFYHFLGGAASGSFYVPYKKVKGWHWESFWIVGGLFSWLIVPPIAAWLTIPHFEEIISQTSASTFGWTFFWGVLWGVGGLMYGLGMRYLGLSLGNSVLLGFTSAFGALAPSINVMKGAEAISEYTSLPRQEAFDIEYWLLEEAKLQRMPKPKPLSGRVALITGSAGGIGKAIAKKFADEGACIILSDNNAERLEQSKEEFKNQYGPDVFITDLLDVPMLIPFKKLFTLQCLLLVELILLSIMPAFQSLNQLKIIQKMIGT